ncbi:MAG: HNH endonuclease [Deltaproteobacteria bacterium]|nr:HNH endonuclease [Deltaproteobacteria bacterium]
MLAERYRSGGSRKKARVQVAVTVCPSCQVGRQLVGNRQVALRPEELARAFCDAEWIDVTGQHRAVQDVTPALRDKVMLRDHGRCRVPGCRSAANIEVHHIIPQELGGPHTMENLIALCDGHHAAHHRGDITIEGPAGTAVIVNVAAARADEVVHVDDRPDQRQEERAEVVHVDNRSDQPQDERAEIVHVDNRSDQVEGAEPLPAEVRADAVLALTTMGFTTREARNAVESALDEAPTSLEQLVRGALRRCAPPRA